MKEVNFRGAFWVVLLVFFLQSLTAMAQVPGGGASGPMIKLFGGLPGFTAYASVQVFSNRAETLRMPSTFSAIGNNLRVDVDMAQIRSAQLSAASIAKLKELGLERLWSVNRPDRKEIYIIYPSRHSYALMPMSKEDADIDGEKLVRTPIARVTLDGHACVKNRSVVKNQKGTVLLDAVTWNAADLQNFPIQIELNEGGSTSVTHFQKVTLAKPDPRLFDAPTSYKRFYNPLDLTLAAVKDASKKKK